MAPMHYKKMPEDMPPKKMPPKKMPKSHKGMPPEEHAKAMKKMGFDRRVGFQRMSK